MPYSDPTPDNAGVPVHHRAPLPIKMPVSSGTALIVGGRGRLMGFSARETGGVNPAQVDLYSGNVALTDLVVTVDLAPGGSTRDWYGPMGIDVEDLTMNVVSGAVTGAVWAILDY